MSEENTIICKLCEKVLGIGGSESHHCVPWCGEVQSADALQDINESDT